MAGLRRRRHAGRPRRLALRLRQGNDLARGARRRQVDRRPGHGAARRRAGASRGRGSAARSSPGCRTRSRARPSTGAPLLGLVMLALVLAFPLGIAGGLEAARAARRRASRHERGALLVVRGLAKSFGGVQCGRRRELRARCRRAAGADRPQRRRQDDLLQHGGRPARGPTPARCGSPAASSSGSSPERDLAPGRRPHLPDRRDLRLADRARERADGAALARPAVLGFWRPARAQHRAEADALLGQRRHGGAGRAGDERARLRRRQARRAGDRAGQPAAPAADGRADRRHGAARAQRADGARAAARARAVDRRPLHRARAWTSCSPTPTASSCWPAAS